MTDRGALRIYYDGDCPFCANYMRLARLRQTVGEVELIDARNEPAIVEAFAAKGYDIDQGMIAELDGTIFYGWEAIWAINAMATTTPVLRWLTNRQVLKAIYPALRAIRNLTIWMRGSPPIRG